MADTGRTMEERGGRSVAWRLGAAALGLALLAAAGCPPPGNGNNNNANANPSSVCGDGWSLVPAGPFTMGVDEGDPRFTSFTFPRGSTPAHTVQLSAYCIQKLEVSVAKFRAAVEAGVSEVPDRTTESHPGCNYSTAPGEREAHPVNCLTWEKARNYCQEWEGGDLPSEAQWEKAARGTTDDRIYPWGDDVPDCSRANFDEDGSTEDNRVSCNHTFYVLTWEAGHLTSSKGDSPYGLKDMAGNVQEWVLDCSDSNLYAECASSSCVDPVSIKSDTCSLRITRGGAGDSPSPSLVSSVFRDASYGIMSPNGVRCVKPVPTGR